MKLPRGPTVDRNVKKVVWFSLWLGGNECGRIAMLPYCGWFQEPKKGSKIFVPGQTGVYKVIGITKGKDSWIDMSRPYININVKEVKTR